MKKESNQLHDCEKCALKRVVITTAEPSQEDAAVFERIVTMLNNTDQILKTPAPEHFSDKDRQAYFNAAIEKNNEAKALLSEWWTNARKTYGVPEYSRFDPFNNIFYYCENPDGTPNLSDEFVPKDEDCVCESGCCSCDKK